MDEQPAVAEGAPRQPDTLDFLGEIQWQQEVEVVGSALAHLTRYRPLKAPCSIGLWRCR